MDRSLFPQLFKKFNPALGSELIIAAVLLTRMFEVSRKRKHRGDYAGEGCFFSRDPLGPLGKSRTRRLDEMFSSSRLFASGGYRR
jgi:hypothetical protein